MISASSQLPAFYMSFKSLTSLNFGFLVCKMIICLTSPIDLSGFLGRLDELVDVKVL